MADDTEKEGLGALLGGPLGMIGAGLGVLQTGIGIVNAIGAKKRQRKLLAQRRAYQTPQELLDILHATQSNAQFGYDSQTLDYLTRETDQAFAGGIGAINRMGGDANDASALFSQKINSIIKVGIGNHEENMKNVAAAYGAMGVLANSRAAEQKSQQDLIKDRLQAEGANLQTASGNISGGINNILSTLSAAQIANLYKQKKAAEAGEYSTDAPPLSPTSSSNILTGGSLAPMGNF